MIINPIISKCFTPTGTINITSNGIHNVTNYANVDVQVPTTVPESYRVFEKNQNNKLISSTTTPFVPLPAGTTDIDEFVFAGAYKNSSSVSGVINLSSLVTISGQSAFYYAFEFCTGITGVDLSSLQTVNGTSAFQGAFYGCSNLTSVDLSSFDASTSSTKVFYNAFYNTGLTSVSFPSLKKIINNDVLHGSFYNCTSLATVDMSSLEILHGPGCMLSCFYNCSALTSFDMSRLVSSSNIGNSNNQLATCFSNCTSLTKAEFPSLKILTSGGLFSQCFSYCSGLTDVFFPAIQTTSFGSRINQFNGMLYGCTDVTIHFPKNLDPQTGSTTLSSLSGYPNFGGTNTLLSFDFPSTVVLTCANSVEYERSPKDDTQTALAWRVKDTGSSYSIVIDWTPFYTSTTADPQVGDTIYSDSACTTAVTTINSIN